MDMEVQSPPPAPPCWNNTLDRLFDKTEPEKKHIDQSQSPAAAAAASELNTGILVGSCKSSKGIAVAVVDATAIIQGWERLVHSADRFVSVAEVINEIRDPASRHSLNFLPFDIDTLEPSPEALKKVVSFAKATGDLQTLSDVDLKLIALTYTLESQFHGTQHLRESPPPIKSVNVKRLPEKDLPGWGSNVPNLKEWEALENAIDDGANHNSRVLPVKQLDVNLANQPHAEDGISVDGSASLIGNPEDGEGGFRKSRRYFPKKEVKIEGKKMVAAGIDASQGQVEDGTADWRPAVSRSTHRRFLRRKARREMTGVSSEFGSQHDTPGIMDGGDIDDSECPELLSDENYEEMTDAILEDGEISEKKKLDKDISASLSKMRLNEEELASYIPCDKSESSGIEIESSANGSHLEHIEIDGQDLGSSKVATEVCESADDISSEQSWALRSLSESSVACVTSDFAMQNVILQMGLRVLAPGGMQIRELHRWVLKCHACFKVTTDIGRIFCPSCGNGGTLRKVAVTVTENGVIMATSRPRISLRGTKFSLPLPQGGRAAVAKNPVLREDQLPQKFLYPKTKKKNKEDEFFIPDKVFQVHDGKKSPHQPPVRKALAVFSGKRNPNDNHYAPPRR